jgi:hypothetical protein
MTLDSAIFTAINGQLNWGFQDDVGGPDDGACYQVLERTLREIPSDKGHQGTASLGKSEAGGQGGSTLIPSNCYHRGQTRGPRRV